MKNMLMYNDCPQIQRLTMRKKSPVSEAIVKHTPKPSKRTQQNKV